MVKTDFKKDFNNRMEKRIPSSKNMKFQGPSAGTLRELPRGSIVYASYVGPATAGRRARPLAEGGNPLWLA